MSAGAGTKRRTIGRAAALAAALALASGAQAQDSGSVSEYRLPDPKQTATPRVQGPVDPDNPYSRPSAAPQPERSPSPAPSVQPSAAARPGNTPSAATTPRPAATPRSVPSLRPSGEEPATKPSARATSRASQSTEPAPSPAASEPTSTSSEASDQPPPVSLPSGVATDDARPVAAAAPTESETGWLIPAAAAAIMAVGAAAFLLRRRRRLNGAPVAVLDPAPSPTPEPTAGPLPQAPRPPAATPRTPSPVSVALPPEPLNIAFVPQAIRLSLVYATLQYELVISNQGQDTTSAFQVRGDLSSAHASISTRDQLAPFPEQLELKHEVAALKPGEAVTLKGEVRVPLQQIRPLVKGSASFLVPLARFLVLPADGAGIRRVYTMGPRDPGSGAIASVRLDAGPRNLRDLDAREIEAARSFALDPQAVPS